MNMTQSFPIVRVPLNDKSATVWNADVGMDGCVDMVKEFQELPEESVKVQHFSSVVAKKQSLFVSRYDQPMIHCI